MTIDNDTERSFLIQLYTITGGDPAAKTTMKDVGAAIGLDKEQSGKVAEELIGKGYVEIKTLSGGIGITSEGVETARAQGAAPVGGSGARLSDRPTLNDDDRQTVNGIVSDTKQAVSKLKSDYTGLEQMVIHIKTIEVYLLAPKPATSVIKALLTALKDEFEQSGAKDIAGSIGAVLN